MFKKLTEIVTGGLFKEIKETVMAYLPPDMTPEAKARLQLEMEAIENAKVAEANEALRQTAEQLNKRIAEQEGTASDLKQLPFVGRIVLFLRGMQRPLWGFFTMWMDAKWLVSGPAQAMTEQQQTAMIVINCLVLGFLFGERTIKNLEPLIIRVFSSGKPQ